MQDLRNLHSGNAFRHFLGRGLDFSAGIWIIATNAAFHRGVCDSVGGCPRNRHWEMASIKPFPKTVIPSYPYGMQKPPTESPMPTTASGICMQTLDTCPAHMLLLLPPSHQGTRHRESCGSLIMLRLQFSSGTAHAPSLPQSPYSSLHRRGLFSFELNRPNSISGPQPRKPEHAYS